jgi:hypothetical protein
VEEAVAVAVVVVVAVAAAAPALMVLPLENSVGMKKTSPEH